MMADAADPWKGLMTKEMRQKLVQNLFTVLKAASDGQDDKAVWSFAANYETATLKKAKTKDEYLKKIAKKITSLNKKAKKPNSQPSPAPVAAPSPAPPPAAPLQPQRNLLPPQQVPKPNTQQLNPEVEAIGGVHLPSSVPMGVSPFSGVVPSGISPALSPQLKPGSSPSLQGMDLNPTDHAYWQRHKQIKDTYYRDMVMVYKEFQKLYKNQSMPDGQQKRVKSFLFNLAKACQVLGEKPGTAKARAMNDLEKVEKHIKDVIMPIRENLRKKRGDGASLNSPINVSGRSSMPTKMNATTALVDSVRR
jgi:hypothetical protein